MAEEASTKRERCSHQHPHPRDLVLSVLRRTCTVPAAHFARTARPIYPRLRRNRVGIGVRPSIAQFARRGGVDGSVRSLGARSSSGGTRVASVRSAGLSMFSGAGNRAGRSMMFPRRRALSLIPKHTEKLMGRGGYRVLNRGRARAGGTRLDGS